MGEEMKDPIMAEVFLESQIGTDTEEVLYTGPLVKAYRFWKKYNWQHPFDQWARLRYEQPDGSMFVSNRWGGRELC